MNVFYGRRVGDSVLEDVIGLTSLKVLDLSCTQVTDAGLEEVKGLANLECLNVYNTQVTFQGSNELQEALPNCEILWSPPPTPKTNLDLSPPELWDILDL